MEDVLFWLFLAVLVIAVLGFCILGWLYNEQVRFARQIGEESAQRGVDLWDARKALEAAEVEIGRLKGAKEQASLARVRAWQAACAAAKGLSEEQYKAGFAVDDGNPLWRSLLALVHYKRNLVVEQMSDPAHLTNPQWAPVLSHCAGALEWINDFSGELMELRAMAVAPAEDANGNRKMEVAGTGAGSLHRR